MNDLFEISCHSCKHTWKMSYQQLKEEGQLQTYRGETTVEKYAVACPIDGVKIIVEITIAEEDE